MNDLNKALMDNVKAQSQRDAIMKYTKIYRVAKYMAHAGEKGITQWDAIRIARHTRLSGSIYDLRARGITIHSREEIGEDGTRYARYWFGDDVDIEKLLNSLRKKSA